MKLNRIVLVTAAVALLLLGAFSRVKAHAVPIQAEPAANSILESAPEQLKIWFNEPVVSELSRIDLLTQAGQKVAAAALVAGDAENRSLVLALPPLNDGTYLVSWQVLSAVDGHTTTGTYSFGIGVASLAGVAGAGATTAQIDPLSAASRWLSLTGIILLLGLFAFRPLLWLPARPAGTLSKGYVSADGALYRQSLKIGWLALALVALASLLTFIDQVGAYDLFSGGNLTVWLATRFGWMWLIRLLLLGLLAVILARLRPFPVGPRDPVWWAGAVLALLLAVTAALISHSAALLADSVAATLVDLAHLTAAGFWAGGLVQLLLAYRHSQSLAAEIRRPLNLQLVVQFSFGAALTVGLLAASGGYLAAVHVGTWAALLGTTYGRLLLAKLLLLLPILLLAAFNLLYVKPRLRQAAGRAALPVLSRFGQFLRLEAALALLIILVVGLLTDAQRAADAPLLADDAGRTVLQQQVEDLTFTMTIEPALVGSNTFDIAISDAQGEPVALVTDLDIRFTFLEQALGSDEVSAEPIGVGLYRVDGAFISLIGDWQVEVAVRRPGTYDVFAPFRLNAGLGGSIQDAQRERGFIDSLATNLTLVSGAVIGFGLLLLGLIWIGVAFRAAPGRPQLVPLLLLSLLAFWVGGRQLNIFFGTEYTPSKFLNNPVLPDQASVQAGQTRFAEHCASCHGELGLGNGPAAVGMRPAPANFTDGHTDNHSDGDLFYWIKKGKAGTAMPAFEAQYSEEEIWHLVNYVRRLSQQ